MNLGHRSLPLDACDTLVEWHCATLPSKGSCRRHQTNTYTEYVLCLTSHSPWKVYKHIYTSIVSKWICSLSAVLQGGVSISTTLATSSEHILMAHGLGVACWTVNLSMICLVIAGPCWHGYYIWMMTLKEEVLALCYQMVFSISMLFTKFQQPVDLCCASIMGNIL